MLTTRARWQVGAKSSNNCGGVLGSVGAGEMGYTDVGDGRTRTGNVLVVGAPDGEESANEDGGGAEELAEDEAGGAPGTLSGSPEAASALTTASQPVSSVLILALSSSFSRSLALSLSLCSLTLSSSDCLRPMRPIPARSCLFSSSSSATRCSRYEN